ncbi:hypothetical protein RhiirC2_804280 [Rhizophagus irregularis]|uniref:Uncharacterized protein n=1 Tax=Rhizophagus irregularis TaxID=588596 RepID=A0A2N1L227_9GLOM|nr:hypothetical protein RhiirC2_804280 [Rhizophagus irregularis]
MQIKLYNQKLNFSIFAFSFESSNLAHLNINLPIIITSTAIKILFYYEFKENNSSLQ